MAYYIVTFEGKEYISREMFMRVFKSSSTSRAYHDRGKLILDTMVFGPMSEEEKALYKGYTATLQDFDAQIIDFVNATGKEKTIQEPLDETAIFTYKNRKYVRITSIKDAGRYRMMNQLPVVRICGRGVYVALDTKNKNASDPIVITEV